MRQVNYIQTEKALKLWILDADVIIDLLSLNVFETLISHCEMHLSTTVIGEVKYFKRGHEKIQINFRKEYVDTGKVQEQEPSALDLKKVTDKLPELYRKGIGDGELESLAVLYENRELTFCSMDGLAIKSLPFLDLSENGISVEKLLKESGVTTRNLKKSHTEEYFQSQLGQGKEYKMHNL